MDLLFNSVQLDFGKQVIRRENIMKKTVTKAFKRIVSTALVATLTLGTVYMAYTRDGNNTTVVETERTEESYEVLVENTDLEHGDSVVEQEIVKTDDIDILQEEAAVSTNSNPQNSECSNENSSVNENDSTNVTEKNSDSETVDLPEVIEDEKLSQETDITDILDEIKMNEIYILSAGVNDETEKDILQWEESADIASVDIYARYDETGFNKIANVADTEYEVDTAADYRIVVNTVKGERIGSNVITLVENEEGYLYEDVVDTDEDGIPDGYEYLIGTNANMKDTDGDGFADGYEVFVLCTNPTVFDENHDFDGDELGNLEELERGTNPYLKDSDFDGINDNEDAEPTKTNVNSGMEVDYTIPVKTGMFDLVSTYMNENGDNCKLVYNYLNKQIKYMSDSENESYNVYNESNQLVAAVEYVDGKFIANTYSYRDGNIETITHNGFQYAFGYDENGNMSEVKVGERNLISNQYDKDMLLSETYGNGHTKEFVYDESGNLISQKENGITVYEWQYDEDGNVVTYKDVAADEVYSYIYDEDGTLIELRSDSGFCIGYEEAENSYSVSYEYEETTKTQTITQTEETDEDGEITKNITTTNLISGGQLVTVITEEDTTERTLYVNETALLSLKYTSSDKGITKIAYQDGKILEYGYDEVGNIVSVTENGELKLSYEYDSLGQLVRENNLYAGKSYTYIYDNAGNVLESKIYVYSTEELTEAESEKKYEYNDNEWKDLLTIFNGQEITYDEIGNPLTYRDGMVFSWAGRGLSTVNIGEDVISYTYNSNGIRTSKTVNGVTTTYLLDDTKIVAETTEDTTIWYIYDENDLIIGFEYENQTYYFEKNVQGDVVKIYDKSGDVRSEYIYDAWGNIVAVYGDESIAQVNPFRYRGYYQDNETGFYYLQSRYYDSETGRFLNADDLKVIEARKIEVLGLNPFLYCDNNPINYIDPTGKILISTCVLAGLAIGAIIGGVVGSIYGYNLAVKLKVEPKDRWKFVAGYGIGGIIVGGVIGSFMGYGIGFLCGATSTSGIALNAISKATASITNKTWGHIIVEKHAWNLVLKNVTRNGVKNIISNALKTGTTRLMEKSVKKGVCSMVYETVYSYMGEKIIVHYAVVDGVLKISDAWVKTR